MQRTLDANHEVAALRSARAARGLSTAEAQQRLTQIGFNDPVAPRRAVMLKQILSIFLNPLVAILIIASLVSAAVGDSINAAIIIAIVLMSAALNFWQTFRSHKAAERLRASVAPTATVLRDEAWVEIPAREVAPGDLVRLTAGDLVPADARLIETKDLHVQEAALTGESLPVEKRAGINVNSLASEVDTDALPFSDDLTASVVALAARPDDELNRQDNNERVFLGTSVVSGTGVARVFATGGRTTYGDIAARLASRPPETEFERGMRGYSTLIMRTVVFLVLFVFLAGIIMRRDALDSLLFAVALAVGLTPEFLPMISTVTLTAGALHMARRKVIVKKLEAMQNFGSIDVLCSDKTGTLTGGEMTLSRYLDPFGAAAQTRIALLAYLNSSFAGGAENHAGELDEKSRSTTHSTPLDAAIIEHGHADFGAQAQRYRKLDEMPFDFERRRASVVIERVAEGAESLDRAERLLIAKGAPESVLSVCASCEADGRTFALDAAARLSCERAFKELSASGYRVLAIAYRSIEPRASYTLTDEKELTLAGFAAFADEPLSTATDALHALRRDGVQVKILTGDNELVARHVCGQVGIDASRILLGDELNRMTDVALAHTAEKVSVFARVTPAQKNRIILALKSRRHVVGFLGDGINDAPSLHAADVGISVSNATDVAKDAAEIILLERSLSVLHNGIVEGRKAFGNVMKYILMETSSNFGNMFSMAAAALFLPFLPMLPVQILLNNFLYGLAQVTIPTDNVDPTFMRKPQHWNIGLIRRFMVTLGPVSSVYDFLTFFVLLRFFHADEKLFHTGWFVESLLTQTLVIFVIRTTGNPLRSRPSRALVLTTLAVVCVGVILPYSPLAPALGFVPLPAGYFLFLLGATATYLLMVQVFKSRLMRRRAS